MYLQLCGDNQSVTFCVPMWLAAPLVWTGCQEHPEQMSPVITDWDQPAYNMVTLMAAPNPTLAGYTWPLPDGKVEIVNETIQLQANLGTTYSMTFKFQLEHKPR
jgi:hypothetical protein